MAALPLGLFATAMFASFLPDWRSPGVLFWFGLAGALGYAAAASLLNRTLIERIDDDIVVRHRPLPFPGKRLRATDMREVRVGSSRGPARYADEAVSWGLTAVLRDGREVRQTWGPMASHRQDLLDDAARRLNVALRSQR